MKRLNRRHLLQGLGFSSGLLLANGCSLIRSAQSNSPPPVSGTMANSTAKIDSNTTCVLYPEQVEGPYYLDLNLLRQDITEGKPGVPLRLVITLVNFPKCTPITNTPVDIWHCDATGAYAGYSSGSTPAQRPEPSGEHAPNTAGTPPRGGGHQNPVNAETFLRGTQITDGQGRVEFVTLYPGWYRGRTTHIHLKVHLDASTVLTSQIYFPDEVTEQVYTSSPYNSRPNRDTTNTTDRIISTGQNATAAIMTLTEADQGYVGLLTVGANHT